MESLNISAKDKNTTFVFSEDNNCEIPKLTGPKKTQK